MKELDELYKVVLDRKTNPGDISYTAYLFEKGLDKILKKIGEECAETIIAAKNGGGAELIGEVCDLFYHVTVLLCERGLTLDDISDELGRRREKSGNLKPTKEVDKNT